MPDLRKVEIPKVTDPGKFEELCRDIWRNDSMNEAVSLNGCSGQNQSGVDVFGRNKETRDWFGIQCKVRAETHLLTKKEILTAIGQAKTFNPSLKKFFICTTLKRNAKIQQIERDIIQTAAPGNMPFVLQIVYWEDLEEMLKQESNINVYQKHYQRFFVNSETQGYLVGKLVNLELGIGDSLDTHYELIVGKIPKFKDEDANNVNYYRGSYFIGNLHEMTMETFHLRCFETDIERAFRNRLDCFRITNWLNSIKNLDDFIYDKDYDVEFCLSKAEFHKYMNELKENRED